jgi:hypothetical protein
VKLLRTISLLLVGLSAACGGAEATVEAPDAVVAKEAPRPKDAPIIATQMVGGKVSALVFMDRVRPHSAASKVLGLGAVKEMLDGTGLDPLNDVERAFITGPGASSQRAVLFAEHTVPEERITALVQNVVRQSDPPGEVLRGAPNWKVRVQKKGRGGVFALLPPRYVVMVPDDLADRVDDFALTGGLPSPIGEEAIHMFVEDPATTLRARGAPPIPPSITSIDAVAMLRGDGGVTVHAKGKSTLEQAPDDARRLTRSVDDATSVGFGPFRIRAFRPIVFSASEDMVVSRVDLSSGEVDQIVSLAGSLIR